MSKQEVEAMAAEAAVSLAPDGEGQGQAVEASPEAAAPLVAEEGFIAMVTPMAGGLANVVCRRLSVTPLSEPETVALGRALAGVLVYYLPSGADPRMVAWATLAAVALGIAGNRQPLPKPAEEVAAARVEVFHEAAAPSPLAAPQSYAGA